MFLSPRRLNFEALTIYLLPPSAFAMAKDLAARLSDGRNLSKCARSRAARAAPKLGLTVQESTMGNQLARSGSRVEDAPHPLAPRSRAAHQRQLFLDELVARVAVAAEERACLARGF